MNLVFDSGEYGFSLKDCKTAKDVIDIFKSKDSNINRLFIRSAEAKTNFYAADIDPVTGDVVNEINSNLDLDAPLSIIDVRINLDDFHNISLYLCTEGKK